MMEYARGDGFADILVCDGVRHRGISVQVQSDGTLTGVYWTERVEQRERNFQLHADGTLGFVAVDNAIKGGFSKKARTTQYQILPRGRTMWIDAVKNGLLVHDAGGHTWYLAESAYGQYDTSYTVISIDRIKQSQRAIDFTEAGLVGVDLAASRVFFLQHRQPTFGGYSDRTTRAYREMTSIFHDSIGQTCAVPNKLLMVPNPNDPKDKTDMAFGYTDDTKLATFLETACPKLDTSPLSDPLEVRD